ncbi:hypothetical protein [Micromonospora zamorensis]|uniref:hypothetical protein n=1 Tax=Micromonospora zamorensis TaxID=709883 RepID=UPI002ED6A0CD|nr:hypothetical protein OG886_10935 [Micromonospora zamorensis]
MGDKSRAPSAKGHHNSMIDPDMTEEEAVAGMPEGAGLSHEQMNVVGQPARPEYAGLWQRYRRAAAPAPRALGIPLTTSPNGRATLNALRRSDERLTPTAANA